MIYQPPSPERVPDLMSQLERYLHDEEVSPDPLIRMAVVHHQFETIHPFYDGNGRTGRIINVLSLVRGGLLDSPILYLSRYISQTRARYYAELQHVRETGEWEGWLVYLLQGVAVTAAHTTRLVEAIGSLLQSHRHLVRDRHRFYSQDLINNIFRHPYTEVAFVEHDLGVSRATAAHHSDQTMSCHLSAADCPCCRGGYRPMGGCGPDRGPAGSPHTGAPPAAPGDGPPE